MTAPALTPPRPAPAAGAASPFVASVVTPEAVLLEFRPAGLASRLLALLVDLLVQFATLYVVLLGAAISGGGGETTVVVVGLVLVFLAVFGYPALFETFWDGRTPGKRALGLRVITTEGGPVRFRHAAIRALLLVVELWIPPGGLTGLTAALLTRRGQRLGDLAAGTIVVRVRRAGDRIAPVWFAPPPGHEAYARSLDVGGLGPPQYQLVRRFLLRAGELSPAARWHLARRLAEGTGRATGSPCPPGLHPEAYLLCVAAAHQQRSAAAGAAGPPPPPPTGAPLPGAPPPPTGAAAAGPPPPPTGPPVPGLPPPAGQGPRR